MSDVVTRDERGASAVEYSTVVVVIGIALVATVGLARVVLTSFPHSTDCYAVATSTAAGTGR